MEPINGLLTIFKDFINRRTLPLLLGLYILIKSLECYIALQKDAIIFDKVTNNRVIQKLTSKQEAENEAELLLIGYRAQLDCFFIAIGLVLTAGGFLYHFERGKLTPSVS